MLTVRKLRLALEARFPLLSYCALVSDRINKVFSSFKHTGGFLPALRKRVAKMLNIFGGEYISFCFSVCFHASTIAYGKRNFKFPSPRGFHLVGAILSVMIPL